MERISKRESHYNREMKREEHLLLQATNEEREEEQEIKIYKPHHKDKQSIVPQRSCEEHSEERGRGVNAEAIRKSYHLGIYAMPFPLELDTLIKKKTQMGLGNLANN
ncbi:hypothetical protein KY285_013908 [Solanum tuberosum]|nr:hypothetical protein KY285_013908 [Solanum tuberosum]